MSKNKKHAQALKSATDYANMTDEQISVRVPESVRMQIDRLSHRELAEIFRFSPSGSFPFTSPPAYEYLRRAFVGKGGMSTEMSKLIGWKLEGTLRTIQPPVDVLQEEAAA